MNEQQAKNLIKETFEKPFEKSQFINFISNLLNLKQNEIINEHPQAGNYIPEAYRQYINSLYRIAKYEDDSGKKIVVLIVHLKKETSLERARSMQRNFIAWYLKLSRGYYKDAALVAFVSPDDEDWRFSFVKIQYLFKDNKAAEMLSSALRYSFLVGKNEISYTAQTQLRPFLLDDISKPSLEMMEQAFSVEKVSNKFFKEYKFLYEKALVEFNSNEVFTKVLEQNSNLSVDLFVRKLLGQVVFLYFLQKKGWLGIKIDEPGWKDGDRKFLRWTFEDCKKKDKNYFDRFLQPLFYTGFNKKEELFQYDEYQFKIPFLNGGLFEELFHWESAFINPANTLFSNNEIHKDGSIGDGILDIFDRYNFTIDENTAFEKEIAVDPEMLGKVFENLLPDNLRKGKGAYYTPREIVAYMTRESLVNYLISKITHADSENKSNIEEKVRRLFDYKDLYINKNNKDKYGKEFENQFYEMLDIVEDVNKHLKEIKIVDPAVGSGAFPMGILLEIVSLREYIETEFLDNKISNYQLKKDTIQNSIYGVDIDPGAVEIAKLRFWLSLIVDAEEPEPLPNLDYKIMQGNSLIESFEGIDLSKVMADKNFEITQNDPQMDLMGDNGKQQKFVFSDKRKETIINLKEKYYPETDPIKKKEIHQKIDKIVLEHIHLCLDIHKAILETQITEISRDLKIHTKDKPQVFIEHLLNESKQAKELSKLQSELASVDVKFTKLEQLYCSTERPFFLWHLYFSEVFEDKDGFDIVIANPPYKIVKKSNTNLNLLSLYKKFYSSDFKINLFSLFVEKSIILGLSKSLVTLIIPDTSINLPAFKKLREFILNESSLINISYYDVDVFKNVSVGKSIILFLKNESIKDSFIFREFQTIFDYKDNNVSYHQVINDDDKKFIYSYSGNIEELLFNRIKSIKSKLVDYCDIYDGINPGSEFTKNMFISKLYKDNYSKKIIDGKNFNKYLPIIWDGSYIFYNENYVEKIRNELKEKNIPFNARIIKKARFFEKDKIVSRQTAETIIATKDTEHYYVKNSIHSTLIKMEFKTKLHLNFVLSILNSKLIDWFYRKESLEKGRLFPQVKIIRLRSLPFIYQDDFFQQPFIKLVDQILLDKKAGKDTQYLESKIDLMVYKLYCLTYEEIEIVDPDFCMSKEKYENFNLYR